MQRWFTKQTWGDVRGGGLRLQKVTFGGFRLWVHTFPIERTGVQWIIGRGPLIASPAKWTHGRDRF